MPAFPMNSQNPFRIRSGPGREILQFDIVCGEILNFLQEIRLGAGRQSCLPGYGRLINGRGIRSGREQIKMTHKSEKIDEKKCDGSFLETSDSTLSFTIN